LQLTLGQRLSGLSTTGERGSYALGQARLFDNCLWPVFSLAGVARRACYLWPMEKRGEAKDRHGRTWTAVVVTQDEAEEADFRFWYEGLSPEERVNAVQDCTLSALKAKGIQELPRLRKVYRVLKARPARYPPE